eukprot:1159564-Pelagomonas_calceolata.AAC.1
MANANAWQDLMRDAAPPARSATPAWFAKPACMICSACASIAPPATQNHTCCPGRLTTAPFEMQCAAATCWCCQSLRGTFMHTSQEAEPAQGWAGKGQPGFLVQSSQEGKQNNQEAKSQPRARQATDSSQAVPGTASRGYCDTIHALSNSYSDAIPSSQQASVKTNMRALPPPSLPHVRLTHFPLAQLAQPASERGTTYVKLAQLALVIDILDAAHGGLGT